MEKTTKTLSKRKSIIDLCIIFLTTTAFVSGFLITVQLMGSSGGSTVSGVGDTTGAALLLQTLFVAFTEFGIMGLGITIVCILRKESFMSFGLKKEKLLLTLALSLLVYLPCLINMALTTGIQGYFPFLAVSFTKSLLASNFPINVIGMTIIAIAWGFFEGFTYVIISDRINKLLPLKHFLLNWGAIICGVFCLLLHTVINLPPDTLITGLCEFLIIYGMLTVRDYTGNAWGTVFIFTFLWNAII